MGGCWEEASTENPRAAKWDGLASGGHKESDHCPPDRSGSCMRQ